MERQRAPPKGREAENGSRGIDSRGRIPERLCRCHAVLGLCYMGAAYMSQHYERTVETAVLGATYVGNSYLANTF